MLGNTVKHVLVIWVNLSEGYLMEEWTQGILLFYVALFCMKPSLQPRFKCIALYLWVPFKTKGPSGKCEEN